MAVNVLMPDWIDNNIDIDDYELATKHAGRASDHYS
jgi:hypothetical protein